MRLELAKGVSQAVNLSGHYVHVDALLGDVRVKVELSNGHVSDYLISERRINLDFIDTGAEVRRVTFENRRNGENVIEYHIGYGRFTRGSDGEKVEVENTVQVSAPAALPVELTGAPVLDVTITNNEALAIVQMGSPDFNVFAEFAPFTTGQTIPANPTRSELIIKAGSGNVGLVWVGGAAGFGLPLSPGQLLKLKTSAAVFVSATDAADLVHVVEL